MPQPSTPNFGPLHPIFDASQALSSCSLVVGFGSHDAQRSAQVFQHSSDSLATGGRAVGPLVRCFLADMSDMGAWTRVGDEEGLS
jgi:hypothetical protein